MWHIYRVILLFSIHCRGGSASILLRSKKPKRKIRARVYVFSLFFFAYRTVCRRINARFHRGPYTTIYLVQYYVVTFNVRFYYIQREGPMMWAGHAWRKHGSLLRITVGRDRLATAVEGLDYIEKTRVKLHFGKVEPFFQRKLRTKVKNNRGDIRLEVRFQ